MNEIKWVSATNPKRYFFSIINLPDDETVESNLNWFAFSEIRKKIYFIC